MKKDELKSLRIKFGLSVSEAALQVHVTPRSWSRYESGERRIPEGVVHLFCIQNDVEYPLRRT